MRRRKKIVSILVTMAFMLAFMIPAAAFAVSDPVKFTSAVKTGLNKDETIKQELGFVKITDIAAADSIYVTVGLPSGVEFFEFSSAPTASIAQACVYADGATVNVVTAKKDKLIVVVDTSDFDADDEIRVQFKNNVIDSVYGSGLKIKNTADDDIAVKITAKGIDNGLEIWSVTDEFIVGEAGDVEINVKAASPKTVTVGKNKKVAKITFSEDAAKAFEDGDVFYIELLDDNFEWNSVNFGKTLKGDYGLEAEVTEGDDAQTLKLTVTSESKVFADELEFTGCIDVYPSASTGDVEVEVWEDDIDADFSDETLVVAIMGDTDVTFSVSDDVDDDIFLATYNNEIDTIKIKASANLSEGDSLIVELPKGLEWYFEDEPKNIDKNKYENLELVGVFNSDRSLWFEVGKGKGSYTIEGLKVAVMPDAEVGDIEVTLKGDFGDGSNVVVGEVLAPVKVSADVVNVNLAELGQAAGNITIIETKKKALDSTIRKDESSNGLDQMTLTLPSGVEWTSVPTVEVNGDKVPAKIDKNDDSVVTVADLELTNRIDEIVISDIEYDLDTRVRNSDIEVEIGGTAFNQLTVLDGKDFVYDEWEDEVVVVVNARAVSAVAPSVLFYIGETNYDANGLRIEGMDFAPFINNAGRTMMPVRFVGNALGIDDNNIMYMKAADGKEYVTLIKGDRVIQLTIGSNVLTINGGQVPLDSPAVIQNGRTLLPLRAVAQAFGTKVDFDDSVTPNQVILN